jgi:hypothetical protein
LKASVFSIFEIFSRGFFFGDFYKNLFKWETWNPLSFLKGNSDYFKSLSDFSDFNLFFEGFFTDFFYNYFLLKTDSLYLKSLIKDKMHIYEEIGESFKYDEKYSLKRSSLYIYFYNNFLRNFELKNLENKNENFF